MRYTVFEHGRPIGETDLGFARAMPRTRCGWFQPNALGETLMPIVGAVIKAICALHRLEHAAPDAREGPRQEVERSTEYADWREAMHRVAELDLELRRPDGTVVPTEHISLQDNEALHEFVTLDSEFSDAAWDDDIDGAVWEEIDLDDDEPCDEEELAADRARFEAWERERAISELISCEVPDPAKERYQIFVTLEDEDAIP